MINIRSDKHYNRINALLDRLIAVQESGKLDQADYDWCEKTRFSLYESISIYNTYINEYKGGHSYGEKKD